MSLPTTKGIPYPKDLDYTKQSVPVPGTKKPGQTGHYRNAIFPFVEVGPTRLTTLTQVFDSGLRQSRRGPCLGHRPLISKQPLKFANEYVWQTYEEVDVRRRSIGSALWKLFADGVLGGGEMDTVGIWLQNRPEWQIIDLALQAYKKVCVSLYDTLGKDSVEYIINHAHLTVIFVTPTQIPSLLKMAPAIPMLKLIVSVDELSPDAKRILGTWGEVQGVQVKELWELEALGKADPVDIVEPTYEQVATLCYTSGTTSKPKGVVLTHGNLAMSVEANVYGIALDRTSCLISYLPLAHIYERFMELTVLAMGARIGYFTGDPQRLLEDAQILRPQLFPSVPRVLNRIYQSAMVAGSAPGLKGALFQKAVQVKLERFRATGDHTHALWDRLVFSKIAGVLGGRLQFVINGSAPLSADVMDFLKISLLCHVVEGYGMTENCSIGTKTIPGDRSASGTIGPPQVTDEIKLIDVPALSYSAEDKPNPRGELCVRGPSCFKVYYKDEENTKNTVDAEGWIHTGDVAEIDSYGRFKIIDRVKNIMKLAQGEYVALEKIENFYSASPAAAQIYVHGDSLQPYLIAVVVADPVTLAVTASQALGAKVTPDDPVALANAAKDQKVKDAVLATLAVEAKKNGLKGFETIKRIHITLEPFSIENGTLTPTFKVRRKDAYARYKAELDALYALGEPKL
ncbi:hypothetical protein PLICRDRAFT_41910 [Plicaturopsis crispa FD-325 SS-3]|nr:hypothetical protein PLICRDRAFT_41910 [Plicaturopsis crispa FD-325 SS-3]